MQTLTHLSFLTSVFVECALRDALIWQGNRFTYQTLREKLSQQLDQIEKLQIQSGAVVGIQGAEGSDFSPNSIALFLALIEKGCILVPYSSSSTSDRERKDSIAQIQFLFQFDRDDVMSFRKTGIKAQHELYSIIRERQSPGLVLFSSGTSGAPKAAVHDFTALLEKFKVRRKVLITLNFLLFDHWGGLNTMLHSLSNGSTIVAIEDRTPGAVCIATPSAVAEVTWNRPPPCAKPTSRLPRTRSRPW